MSNIVVRTVATLLGLSLGFYTTNALAQTEVLVPPTSVEERFILTENVIDLPAELADQVGYPVWQKVGMNSTVSAVPANWCQPLLLAKPWLIETFGGNFYQAEENCWLSVSLATAELGGIEVPESSQTQWTSWWDNFWRNRPNGFQYWVPSFSVSEADYYAFAGLKSSGTFAGDPTALVEQISALESRVEKLEEITDANTNNIADLTSIFTDTAKNVSANTAAIADLVGVITNRPIGLSEAEVDARIDAKLPAISPGPPSTSSLFGYRLDRWVLGLVVAVALLFGLMVAGLITLRHWRQKDNERLAVIEEVVGIQIERDMAGRYHAPPGFETLVNNLKVGEHFPLTITSAGRGAAIPKVNLIREVDSKGVPVLRLEGVTPGQNIIHAKKVKGEWRFELSQIWLRLGSAEQGGLIEGLGKPEAADEIGTVPGTQRLKQPVSVDALVFTKPVFEGRSTNAAARIKATIAGVRAEKEGSETANELPVIIHQVDGEEEVKPLGSDVPLVAPVFDQMLATARMEAGGLTSPSKPASA